MSYPTSPEFNAINLESKSPTVFSEAVNGRMQSRKIGGQRWSFTAQYPNMTRADFQPVWAFCIAQQGRHGIFQITLPIIGDASGDASGTVTSAAGAVGDTSVTVSGLTGSLKAGDFIKFSGHDKVYMVTADRAGNGAMSIEPGLVATVSAAEQITYDQVPFTVRLANDVQSYKIGLGQFFTYEVDFVEAL